MQRASTNILFGDVKGYSGLKERQLLTFAEVVLPRAARTLEGRDVVHVNTWGDGIVVAVNAVKDIAGIALELRDLFLNMDWEALGMPNLDVRLSIHHGEYLKGTDAFSGGGLITGRSVIRAARIEPVTKPGSVWVTQAVHVALQDEQRGAQRALFATDAIGEVTLAKEAGPEHLYQLRRAHEAELSEADRHVIAVAAAARQAGPPKNPSGNTQPGHEACVGVVKRGNEVLLVRRQKGRSELQWMFPAAKKQALDDEHYVVTREVRRETGIDCTVVEKITTVDCHPITGAMCHYYLLQALDDSAPVNLDLEENADARFVPISEVEKYITRHLTQGVIDCLRA